MPLPFVIDNQDHRMSDALNDLLAQSAGKPLDIATAYFAISGYRLVKEGLHQLGAFRLILGSEPHAGTDVGLRPNPEALKKRLQGDLEAEPFTEATLRLIEELTGFLRTEKVEVRLYDHGFLHAKAYLFHQDKVGPKSRADRLRPFAAIVGSSNFAGPGLVSNKELNLVHRVILPTDDAVDREAADRVGYLYGEDPTSSPTRFPMREGGEVDDIASPPAALLAKEGEEVERRFIKSEVGARAITDLMSWYERQWADSVDFKDALIELLDASKFGTKEYTPYEVYTKALKDGSVIVFDLKTSKVLGKVKADIDADGIIYDPASRKVLVSCGDAGVLVPIAPDVDLKTGKADSAVHLGGKPEFLVADGQGKVFINLVDKDQVAVIDTKAMKVADKWPTAPGGSPVGMSMDTERRRLFVGCRKPQKLIVMSAEDGKVLADLPIGAGVDATQFDNGYIFASCGDGSLAVAQETSRGKFQIVQDLKTRPGAKTMAVDSTTHTVFLPTAEFGKQTNAKSRPIATPETFMVVVVRPSKR